MSDKEDIKYECAHAAMVVCIVLVGGLTMCLNTYIHEYYQFQSKSMKLRHPLYGV